MLLTFLSIGMFVSCGEDKTTGNGEALTITPDAATHYEGESFKFTVTTGDGSDVSDQAAIMVDDKSYTANSFYSLTPGTFTVKATYSGTTTKPVQITVAANPTPMTALTVTPSSTNVMNGDVVTFAVAGDNSSVVTQACSIYVNGNKIEGNTYTATEAGTLEVYATYPAATTITSSTVSVLVNQAINFNKRVLVEDYTGTWCGWCPRVAFAIEEVLKQSTDVVPVAIHVSGSTQAVDPFQFSGVSTLMQAFGVSGFPTAKLNRKTTWTADEPSNLKQVTDLTKGINPRVGLAMTTTMANGSAEVKVNVKFGQNFTGLKLVVYAVENKLIYDQHNYTKLYGGTGKSTDVIKDFEYNDVLRASLTNVLGDAIDGSTNVNDVYTKTFTYAVPQGVNAENVHFVAFVVDANKKALNVRSASNNADQEFEIE
jgi:thiol-disulfide isomerase/thioredoxin